MRYYTLLRISFESTNLYKIFETGSSQIYRFFVPQNVPAERAPKDSDFAIMNYECPKCHSKFQIQANLRPNVPIEKESIPYPISNDIFTCPNCGIENNLAPARLQIEAQSGKKAVM